MADGKPAKPDPFGDAIKAIYGQPNNKTKEYFDALAGHDPLKRSPPAESYAQFLARRLCEVWPW